MNLDYVVQDVTSLRFAFYACAVDPESFRILRERTLRRRNYSADLWIIGTSHVLRVHVADHDISEVLTCSEPVPVIDSPVHSAQAGVASHYEHHVPDVLTYSSDMATDRYSSDAFQRQHADVPTDEDPRRLAYEFPTEDPTQLPARTVIEVAQEEDTLLRVRTWHSYPQDRAIVRTNSTIQIPRPRYAARI